MGQNPSVARKRDKVDNELEGGTLSHNPFGSLLGGTAGKKSASSRETLPQTSPTPAPVSQPGAGAQKIVVRFEAKGHGGKSVTRISGLPVDSSELEQLAGRLKKAMGSGARIEEGDVLVQGKLVQRVMSWLQKNGHKHVVRGN